MASQQTTRQLWAEEGPFRPYSTVRGLQTVPPLFVKGATWHVGSSRDGYHAGEGYYAQSSANNDPNEYYPVEFNSEYGCWVEVRWIENLEIGGHWEAFRPQDQT